MTVKKSLTIVGFIIAAIIALVASIYRPDNAAVVRAAESEGRGPDASGPSIISSVERSATNPGSKIARAIPLPRDFGSPAAGFEIGEDDPLRLPGSKEEIEWLHRSAYPSFEAYREADINYMDAMDFPPDHPINATDIAKAEIFATRFPADSEIATGYLYRAAASGSIYALEALSRFHRAGPGANAVTSAAYHYAAEIRGNWALGSMRPALPSDEAYLATLHAQSIIQSMNKARQEQGWAPLGFEPRPGLDEFLSNVREQYLKIYEEEGK